MCCTYELNGGYKSRYPIVNLLNSIASYIQATMTWLVVNTIRGSFRYIIKSIKEA